MSEAQLKMRGLMFDAGVESRVRLREDLSVPSVKEGELLVRVTHSTINGYEFDMASDPLLRVMRWWAGAPGQVRTGLEFAGVVKSDGVTFKEGDRVMGYVDMIAGWRPHADYVSIPEAYVSRAPRGVSLAEASTLPMSTLTALASLRDVAGVQADHEVLILGASGGVGVMAVQIARILGAKVTAVASSRHREALERYGAQDVIDYRETSIEALRGSFDAILDFSITTRLKQVRHLLSPGGIFVPADPIRNLTDVMFSSRAGYLMVDKGDSERLSEIATWVEEGKLEAVVSEMFTLDDWQRAVSRSHERGRMGRTVLQFEDAPSA